MFQQHMEKPHTPKIENYNRYICGERRSENNIKIGQMKDFFSSTFCCLRTECVEAAIQEAS